LILNNIFNDEFYSKLLILNNKNKTAQNSLVNILEFCAVSLTY